ncbi:TetR/AcrR family transcriptional regulator [Micromonospora sp. M12]
MAAKTDDSGPVLPPAIESAWGLRERPPRPRPGMSVQAIVDAAVRVADADGLAAVSMSRVARSWAPPPWPSTATSARRTSCCCSWWTPDTVPRPGLLHRRSTGAPVSPGGPGPNTRCWGNGPGCCTCRSPAHRSPQQLGWMEDGLRCLDGTRLGESEKMSSLLLLTGYVRNEATLQSQIAEGSKAAGVAPGEVMPAYGRMMARLIDPTRFPALHRW